MQVLTKAVSKINLKYQVSSMSIKGFAKSDHVGNQLCDKAYELSADVLVVGRRLGDFQSWLKRATGQSVSDYCLHHAQCPVLIVKEIEI